MPWTGFEPTFSAGERPQTYALRPRGHWDRLVFNQIMKKIHLEWRDNGNNNNNNNKYNFETYNV
jgi:hypothetical protein